MENKILELNTKVIVEKSMKLIDLNGKKISFKSDCSVKTTSNEPFYIAIVNQNQLDEGKIPFELFKNPFERRVTYESEDGQHVNHYIAFKNQTDKEIQCDIKIKLSDIEPKFSKIELPLSQPLSQPLLSPLSQPLSQPLLSPLSQPLLSPLEPVIPEIDKEELKQKLSELSDDQSSFYRNIGIGCFVIIVLFILLRR